MIVIADDITGAAEIAGLAYEAGHQVRLVCGCPVCSIDNAIYETTVIATDSRSMTENEAAALMHTIAATIPQPVVCGLPAGNAPLLFKKTDSALRGHVVAELSALLAATGLRRAVYLPANPTKGRIIRNSVYYIKEQKPGSREQRETPLHETAFSYDPEFPATTSILSERFPDATAHHILMPDAETLDDIHRVVDRYNDGNTLFAGAADLFKSLFPYPNPEREEDVDTIEPSLEKANGEAEGILILCGSTQSRPLNLGIAIAPMPREVYDGKQTADDWFAMSHKLWATANRLILTIPYAHRTGHAAALYLRQTMAKMAHLLISHRRPAHLVIEGGATAWATLSALGWTDFTVVGQLAPGVVQLHAACGTLVTLKPGSYPWPHQINM